MKLNNQYINMNSGTTLGILEIDMPIYRGLISEIYKNLVNFRLFFGLDDEVGLRSPSFLEIVSNQ